MAYLLFYRKKSYCKQKEVNWEKSKFTISQSTVATPPHLFFIAYMPKKSSNSYPSREHQEAVGFARLFQAVVKAGKV